MLRAAIGDRAGRPTQGPGTRRARARPPSPGPDAAPGGPWRRPWPGDTDQVGRLAGERRGRLTPPQLAIPIRRGAKSDVSPPPTHLWRDAVPPGPRVPARVCGCATIHTVTRRAAGGGARRITPVPAHGL